MDLNVIWYGSLAVALTVYLVVVVAFAYLLPPVSRRIYVGMVAAGIALSGCHVLLIGLDPPLSFWTWFLDVNAEFSLGTLFSALQLLTIALIALVIAWRVAMPRGWLRIYWLVFGLAFIYFAIDEGGWYQIHEAANPMTWRIAYAGIGVALGMLALAFYWFGFRQERLAAFLFFFGLGVMGFAGVFVEQLLIHYMCPTRLGVICGDFFAFEEFFEMAGASIVLASVLVFAERHYTPSIGKTLRLALPVGLFVLTLWLMGNLWIFPAMEARLVAEPARVEYFDGAMKLVGYHVRPAVIKPGDTVTVDLYWTSDGSLDVNYHWSIRLLTQPDGESVAYRDRAPWGQYPTSAWLPGLVARKTIVFEVPEEAPVPASYWVMMSIWRNVHDPTFIEYSDTDQYQLGPAAVVLGNVPALPVEAPVPSDWPVYTFADGLELASYALPETVAAGETLDLAFWWQTGEPMSNQYTQFVHVIPQAEGELFSADQDPFAGGFPMVDWPTGTVLQDESWQLAVPVDAAAGIYEVFTGLYDPATVERLSVTAADGNAVPNSAILLGAITVE